MKAWMYEVKYYRIYHIYNRLEKFSWWQLKERRTEKSLSDDCLKPSCTVLVEGTKS